MEWLMILPMIPIVIVIWFTSNGVRIFAAKLTGRTVVYCKRVDGEGWYSIVATDPFGELIAYRYVASKIGTVKLNDDGTGYYCGHIKWVRV